MNTIIIFTDGSVPNNQNKGNRKGGIGVFFGNDDIRNISYSLDESPTLKVTNQVCELLACIKGIVKLISTQKIEGNNIIIRTDSLYIVNTINDWAKKWEKNNWKKSDNKIIQNEELVKQLYYLSLNLSITFEHVKAHTKEPDQESPEYFNWYGNHMADKLAVLASS